MNGLPSDLTSSHSSQRIVNARLPNNDPSPGSSFLMLIPNSSNQQQSSQRSSQGNINQFKILSSSNAGAKTEATPPVLENAYI